MKKLIPIKAPLSVITASLILAGCSLAPTYERPTAPIPVVWSDPIENKATANSTAAALQWQSFVTDEALRKLIQISLDNNRDLRQALLNVEAARAQYQIQRADRVPGFEGQGTGTRQRVPGDSAVQREAGVQETYQVGVGLTAFELDIFGRVRNLSQAALQEYLSTEEAARGVQISLIAEVIQAYLIRDGALHRHALTQQTLQSRMSSLALIERRRQAGTTTALEYQDALGLTEQAKVEIERTSREFRQASNALALLLGVSDLKGHLPEQPMNSTMLLQDIGAGTPSDLLMYRPDVRAAEHQLQARNANIGAARAAFFPRISLTGFLGSSSTELSDLFNSGQRTWSFAPQISIPIFNGGRNRANLDLANLRKDQAIASYEKSIQTAFREVSDALAATDTLRREEAAQSALAKSSQLTLNLAQARYRAGVDDHLRYLDAQRSDFANQIALIQVETQRQIALATLFKTLGGGWQTAQ